MKNLIGKIFSFSFVVIISGILLISCKTTGHSEKYYEKQEKKKSDIEQKEYNDKIDRHKSMQSESTRKMLKKMERESKRLNKSRKPKSKPCSTP